MSISVFFIRQTFLEIKIIIIILPINNVGWINATAEDFLRLEKDCGALGGDVLTTSADVSCFFHFIKLLVLIVSCT